MENDWLEMWLTALSRRISYEQDRTGERLTSEAMCYIARKMMDDSTSFHKKISTCTHLDGELLCKSCGKVLI